jgi:hypothetical protein
MAVVYRAVDTLTGGHVALKRLQTRAGHVQRNAVALFQREFLTLTHLVHPRVVTVYDYGVDDGSPYYTMELLDGGDLQRLAPMPYRDACAVARDVCSALSLLHSRRTIYRDLSPRNVRCTSSGSAKLIDFGAMSPMGLSRDWVGTLPFCAPEVVNSQPLDARTDLYSVGATLYYTLTGRNAYPARDVPQLYSLWRERPERPSELVAGIPEALDCLVMDLMHPDPTVRPVSAAEVMERLSAIAGLPADEQPLVSQAYLFTPTLVGRVEELKRIRKIVVRALRHRGATVLLHGPSGVGRSRLLQACVLEAKLAGAVVLQADSSDIQDGNYALVRALAAQLLEVIPDLALTAAAGKLEILGRVIPKLLEKAPSVLELPGNSEELGPQVQRALRQWLLDISVRKPLLIAIDDFHAIDEASAAFLALLSQEASQHALVVAATAVTGASASANVSAALKLLAEASTPMPVQALSIQHTEELLSSVFGDVPNLSALAHRLHGIANGNPRDILRLAQHLVDHRMVRYQAGAWSVPERFDTAALPSSMAQALKARITALHPDARQLAQAMAYEPRQRFNFEECLILTEHRQSGQLVRSLDELVAAEMLRSNHELYNVDNEGLVAALRDSVDPVQHSWIHLRLAEVFEGRGDGSRFAQHLVHGGQIDRGLDALVTHAEVSWQQTGASPGAYNDFLRALPDDWYAFYELGLRLCQERGRPLKDAYRIRRRLAGILTSSLGNHDGAAHYTVLLEQLFKAVGLDIYAGLDASEAPAKRLELSLEQAQQRYDANPDGDFVLPPMAAIPQLLRVLIEALALVAFSNDYAFLKAIPSLTPLAPLSPSLTAAIRLTGAIEARITGRIEKSLEFYRPHIENLATPDGAGIVPTVRLYTRLRLMGSVGMQEAAMGLASSLTWADEIQAHPLGEAASALIRMLYHLWQGNVREAERYKRQIELLQIQSSSRVFGEQHLLPGRHVLSELTAHALSDDLTRVKQSTDAIEPLARVHKGWEPVLHYGRGEYHRIRGDYLGALQELESALQHMQPGCHQIWPYVSGARIRALYELGRVEEARTRAEEDLRVAGQIELGYLQCYIQMPFALVQARLGDYAGGAATADQVIGCFEALGSTGLNLALAYETRARVESGADDRAAFENFTALSAKQVPSGSSRLLRSKLGKAVRASRTVSSGAPLSTQAANVSDFISALKRCGGAAERARCALEMLVRCGGATGGVLYTKAAHTLERSLQIGTIPHDIDLDALANMYFQSEAGGPAVSHSLMDPNAFSTAACEWSGSSRERYVPVLLSHQATQGLAVTGLAVLVLEPQAHFIYPGRIAEDFSRLTLESRDADVTYV